MTIKVMIKFLVVYLTAKVINLITGFSYNVLTEEFNLVYLVIDLSIWIIAYSGVSVAFSKLLSKQKNLVE